MFEGTKRLLEEFFGKGDLGRKGEALGEKLKNNPNKPAPFR